MLNKYLVLVATCALVGITGPKEATAHDLGKGGDSNIVDSSGHVISDGFGDCVSTGTSNNGNVSADCGAAPVKAAAEPAPAAVVESEPEPVAVNEQVSLAAGALFDVNSDSLKDAGKQELSELATGIKAMQEVQSVRITGHTDSTGAESYNQTLSQRRANSVKNYLLDQGVSPTVMSTSGMGESQPIADNKTREGRAKNRRVEISIEGFRAQ